MAADPRDSDMAKHKRPTQKKTASKHKDCLPEVGSLFEFENFTYLLTGYTHEYQDDEHGYDEEDYMNVRAVVFHQKKWWFVDSSSDFSNEGTISLSNYQRKKDTDTSTQKEIPDYRIETLDKEACKELGFL